MGRNDCALKLMGMKNDCQIMNAKKYLSTRVLISCMQIPVPRPPVPINPSHKVPI